MCIYHQLGSGLKKPWRPKDEWEQYKNEPATDDFSQNGNIQLMLKQRNERELRLFQNEVEYHRASTARRS